MHFIWTHKYANVWKNMDIVLLKYYFVFRKNMRAFHTVKIMRKKSEKRDLRVK